MKKNITFTVLLLFMVITQKIKAQVECFTANPFIVELDDNISYYNCIETPTGVYHNNSHHAKSWLASDFIDLNGITPYLPTEFNPYGFQANIKPGDFAVGLMAPSNASAVPKWGMIEYGIALPPNIAQKVKNFVEDLPGDKINPYLEWELKVTAIFHHGSTVITRDGFYTKDFTASYPSTIPTPASGDTYSDAEYTTQLGTWTEVPTAFPFRVRFAPGKLGGWAVYFIVTTPNASFTSPDYLFHVVPSNLKPPLKVGPEKKYFTQSGKSFIPAGCNIGWPQADKKINPTFYNYLVNGDGCCNADYRSVTAPPIMFKYFRDKMSILKTNGANFFRCIFFGSSFDIEYEHLGNYTNRLQIAYEMDKIVSHAEQLDLYIDLNTLLHNTLQVLAANGTGSWDWKTDNLNNNNPLDVGYCYQRELNLGSIEEFYTSATAQKYYRQKLRYIVARWGYSPHLSMIELDSEINDTGREFHGITVDGKIKLVPTAGTDYYYHTGSFQTSIYNWHKEMAEYLRNDLNCRQLIGPSYNINPGEIAYDGTNFEEDKTYSIPQMDFKSRNSYDYTTSSTDFNYFKNNSKLNLTIEDHSYKIVRKPMVFSEFGPSQLKDCSGNGFTVEINRRIWKMLFSGFAMTLSWYQMDHPENLSIYGRVKQFIQGYNLADGNWFPGNLHPKVYNGSWTNVPKELWPFMELFPNLRFFTKDNWEENMTRHDLKADLMYLRAGDRNRAIGVITNRTWNYWTATNGTCGVAPEYSYKKIFHPHQNVDANLDVYVPVSSVKSNNNVLKNKLRVMGMKWKKYAIYYFDAKTLQLAGIQIEWGPKLNLEHPDLTSSRPFVLFKAVLLDELINDGSINPGLTPSNEGVLAGQQLRTDSLLSDSTRLTERTITANRKSSINVEQIKLYPNPNNGSFVLLLSNDCQLGKIEITDVSGKTVHEQVIKEKQTTLNLRLQSGVYYLHFANKNTVQNLQFMVQ